MLREPHWIKSTVPVQWLINLLYYSEWKTAPQHDQGELQQPPDTLAKVQNTELRGSAPCSSLHAGRLLVKRGKSQRSGPLLISWVASSGEEPHDQHELRRGASSYSSMCGRERRLEPRFPWGNSSEKEQHGQRIPPGHGPLWTKRWRPLLSSVELAASCGSPSPAEQIWSNISTYFSFKLSINKLKSIRF